MSTERYICQTVVASGLWLIKFKGHFCYRTGNLSMASLYKNTAHYSDHKSRVSYNISTVVGELVSSFLTAHQ